MIGVKLTILMIVVTFVYIYIARVMVKHESAEVKLKMLIKDEVPGYVYLIGILVVLDFIGIIYSVIYLLFFMKW